MLRNITRIMGVVLLATLPLAGTTATAQAAPESDVGAVGQPPGSANPVRGFVDAHSHLMANEAFGGSLICGKPFDLDGIEHALVDCPDHQPDGSLAWFENFTRHGTPVGKHDPVGWPTFKDWPAHDSLTHQQGYYKWLERAWRGGLRIFVNDLVANRQLCEIYPLKHNTCDEMATLRLEAQRTFELQDYIDAQSGGPGQGWFRVVKSTAEARQVIATGKLAVVLGVETSEPFGCRQTWGIPHCTKAQIDRGLDEMYQIGVRSMFVCHKYDNALCGVRFDSGTTGVIVNIGNFLASGSFWNARTCTGAEHDNTIDPAGVLPPEVARWLPPGVGLPVYPAAPHCNTRGLTSLGSYMVQGMMKRGMIVELDHMSVKAAAQTLDLLESAKYPGVISSHSWADPSYFRRIYRLGGMVTAYGSPADSFTAGWRTTKPLRDEFGHPGYGYGLDTNGMGPLPGPRQGSAVTYPFTSLDGAVTLDRLRTGERVWDVNTDGVAHYGLVPDWIEDMRKYAGNEFAQDMLAGAEAYLKTWGGAETRRQT
ncbi:membrane dipeptidase [Nonomuraea sp. SMC257]|uniref:Membrane dipeptidase n=1 Tax=Nonomuraea montanisoli TaxID=2741721 RepID=A0A7Y6M6J6_9ACTN|nr:membrane dipeptidase [Nonomuraea montanisoli]NUW35671.1 membrane dipeptidase [Nonomuraea montanisoli]